jgi:hypothetical protein
MSGCVCITDGLLVGAVMQKATPRATVCLIQIWHPSAKAPPAGGGCKGSSGLQSHMKQHATGPSAALGGWLLQSGTAAVHARGAGMVPKFSRPLSARKARHVTATTGGPARTGSTRAASTSSHPATRCCSPVLFLLSFGWISRYLTPFQDSVTGLPAVFCPDIANKNQQA